MKTISKTEILTSMAVVTFIAVFGLSLLLQYAELFIANAHRLV